MARHKGFPTGVAQDKVLRALGLKAQDWDEAEAIFARIGISVSAKRVGHSSEPVVRYLPTQSGAFNEFGEGETWDIDYAQVDLTPLASWMQP